MQHTLGQLRTLQNELMQLDLDNAAAGTDGTISGSTELASQLRQLNWAYELLCARLQMYDPLVTVTLYADDGVLDLRVITGSTNNKLSKRIIELEYLMINGAMLLDRSGEPGLWTLDELNTEYPGWQIASSGTPSIAAKYDYTKVRLYPKPSGAFSNNYASGIVMPALLSDEADVPAIPSEIHEAIAVMSVEIAATPMASEAEAWQRLQAYKGGYLWSEVNKIAGANARIRQSWGSPIDHTVMMET